MAPEEPTFFAAGTGPVHEEHPEPAIPARAWCGSKRQYRHLTLEGPATCRPCIKRKKEAQK